MSRIYRTHPAEIDRRPVLHKVRCLSADEQDELRDRYAKGWTVAALTNCYGISRRTVYRYVEGELVDVEVGGYIAAFWLRPGRVPEQAEPWQRVEAAA